MDFNFKSVLRLAKNKRQLFASQIFILPIVVCGFSVQVALAVTLVAAMVIIPSTLILNLLKNRLKIQIGVREGAVLNIFISCLFYVAGFSLAKSLYPGAIELTRSYLPVLVLHTFALSGSKVFTNSNNHYKPFGFKNALLYVLFFGLEMLGFAFVRELLGAGSVWGVKVTNFKTPGFLFPFGGFILMGFFMAWQEKLLPPEAEPEQESLN